VTIREGSVNESEIDVLFCRVVYVRLLLFRPIKATIATEADRLITDF
jgi:hypothetical protein